MSNNDSDMEYSDDNDNEDYYSPGNFHCESLNESRSSIHFQKALTI